MDRYLIRVDPWWSNNSEEDLFRSVGLHYSVVFDATAQNDASPSGELLFGEAPLTRTNEREILRLIVPQRSSAQNGGRLVELNVRFSDDPEVPFPFRGASVRSKSVEMHGCLKVVDHERVLATDDEGPIWVVSNGRPKQYRSALSLPAISSDQSFVDVFNGDRFIEMLPILHFVRAVGVYDAFQGPPLRAAFMFDDPNLHWYRYGCVDFCQVANSAAKNNYHVSFATIPLDMWFTHRDTARLFKNSAHQLSLLIHGNDHSRMELLRTRSERARRNLLAQAIARVQRFESKTSIGVSRVMAAPHGACSPEMLRDLPRFGFEAATISHGSLLAHIRPGAWTRNIGYKPCELIEGCPVLPRWRMSSGAKNAIFLAAYLQQAIVLVGHHYDLRSGVDLLEHLADLVNGLGNVTWGSMTELCRSNYQWRVDGSRLSLRLFGNNVEVEVPQEVSSVVVQDPAGEGGNEAWQISYPGAVPMAAKSGVPVSVPGGRRVTVSREPQGRESHVTPDSGRNFSASALFRRLLTETRDRLLK